MLAELAVEDGLLHSKGPSGHTRLDYRCQKAWWQTLVEGVALKGDERDHRATYVYSIPTNGWVEDGYRPCTPLPMDEDEPLGAPVPVVEVDWPPHSWRHLLCWPLSLLGDGVGGVQVGTQANDHQGVLRALVQRARACD